MKKRFYWVGRNFLYHNFYRTLLLYTPILSGNYIPGHTGRSPLDYTVHYLKILAKLFTKRPHLCGVASLSGVLTFTDSCLELLSSFTQVASVQGFQWWNPLSVRCTFTVRMLGSESSLLNFRS